MGGIQWAMWANEQAVMGSVVLIVGSIIGVAGMFNNWQFAAAVIPASVLIFLFEYPRGAKVKDKRTDNIQRNCCGKVIKQKESSDTITRWNNGHKVMAAVVNKMSPVTTNYFLRSFVLAGVSVPCCFLLPTLMGGIFLMISSLIYFVAACSGEKWYPLPTRKPQDQESQPMPSMTAPTREAPKPFQSKHANGAVVVDDVELTSSSQSAASALNRPPPKPGKNNGAAAATTMTEAPNKPAPKPGYTNNAASFDDEGQSAPSRPPPKPSDTSDMSAPPQRAPPKPTNRV